jgi:hypothetical protein
MKVMRDWADNEELMVAVTEAMSTGDIADEFGVEVDARNEEGSYGERGYIELKYDGRRFRLALEELL